jgi:hypothetical protein
VSHESFPALIIMEPLLTSTTLVVDVVAVSAIGVIHE